MRFWSRKIRDQIAVQIVIELRAAGVGELILGVHAEDAEGAIVSAAVEVPGRIVNIGGFLVLIELSAAVNWPMR